MDSELSFCRDCGCRYLNAKASGHQWGSLNVEYLQNKYFTTIYRSAVNQSLNFIGKDWSSNIPTTPYYCASHATQVYINNAYIYIYIINGYLNNLIYNFDIDSLRLSYAISREGIFPAMAHALSCLISALLANPDTPTMPFRLFSPMRSNPRNQLAVWASLRSVSGLAWTT